MSQGSERVVECGWDPEKGKREGGKGGLGTLLKSNKGLVNWCWPRKAFGQTKQSINGALAFPSPSVGRGFSRNRRVSIGKEEKLSAGGLYPLKTVVVCCTLERGRKNERGSQDLKGGDSRTATSATLAAIPELGDACKRGARALPR